MKRILITGAQGFLGRYLVRALDRSGMTIEMLGLGRSPASEHCFTHRLDWLGHNRPAPLPHDPDGPIRSPYCYRQVDICNQSALVALFSEFQPHWVFHLASGLRDDSPAGLCRTNVEGSTVLTQALVDAGCRPEKVVYGSSGSVYGVPRQLPLDEDAATEPCNLYGITKLAGERSSRLLTDQNELPAVWARLFNLVGPGQDERHVCGYFAGSLAHMLTSARARRMSVGPLTATRDFIDVRDAARALVLLASAGQPGQTYNIASGYEVAISEVLASLLQHAGLTDQVRIDEAPARAGDVARHVADVKRLKRIGFAPQMSLHRSLHDLLNYYTTQVACAAILTT